MRSIAAENPGFVSFAYPYGGLPAINGLVSKDTASLFLTAVSSDQPFVGGQPEPRPGRAKW